MKRLFVLIIVFILPGVFLIARNEEAFKTQYFSNFIEVGKVLDSEYKASYEKLELDEAVSFLKRSKPNEAITILFELLETVGTNSEYVDIINTYIAEAYREKREYKKGIDLLYAVMEKDDVDLEYLTYAYTRIAAIYNEWKYPEFSFLDSVVKYSELSIAQSKRNGFIEYLALSQNELGHVMIQKEDYTKAKELLSESMYLFLSLGMNEYAAGVSVNLSNSYLYDGDFQMAERIIDSSLLYCNEKGNENMFMRLFMQKAKVSQYKEDYKTAYEYLSKARLQQSAFFEERLDAEIIEMSAKYDLELKESKIAEEQQKVQISKRDNAILLVLVFVLLISLIA
jgi:tetratricopeptide (TPR) repeat protein